MKKRNYFLNTVLTILITLGLGAAILVRTFAPIVILPRLSIPALVLISVLALVTDHYVAPGARHSCIWVFLFSFLSFGLLPYAAGFINALGILIYGAAGAVVFTVSSLLYSLIMDRLSTGPVAKLAPILSGLGLYLASQCFMNILL